MPRDIDEGPSCADLERFGGDEVTCPSCGTEVYYDATFCHECGHVMEEKATGTSKKWIVIAALIALLAFGYITIL